MYGHEVLCKATNVILMFISTIALLIVNLFKRTLFHSPAYTAIAACTLLILGDIAT